MNRNIVLSVGFGFALMLLAGAQDHKVDEKKLKKVKDDVKAQKAKPKSKADLAKDANAKLHEVESKTESAVKNEAKLDAAVTKAGKGGDKLHKADGAAHKLAKTAEHLKNAEANAGETKDKHKKAAIDKTKKSVEDHKKKAQSKDDLKKQESETLFSLEIGIDVGLAIDVQLDASAAHEKKRDPPAKIDAEMKKFKALEDKIHKEEASDAAWMKALADRAWVEAVIKDLHTDLDELVILCVELDKLGFHEEADELDFWIDEMEDLLWDLADEWLLLHLDEFKAAEIDTYIVWVADLDEWHEWNAMSWDAYLTDTFWFEATLDEIHLELGILEADLAVFEADFKDVAVAYEKSCFDIEVSMFAAGEDWLLMHCNEWDEAHLEVYEEWTVDLSIHVSF